MIFYAFVAVMSSLVILYIIDHDSDDRYIDQDFETQFSVSFVMIVLGAIWPVSLPFLGMFFGFRYISKWKKDNGH